MFSNIIDTLGGAFKQVVDLVGDIFGEGFGAIEQLSSGLF